MNTKYKVVIAGVEYGHEDIRSASIERPLFDTLSIGNACEGEMKIVFRPKEDIPRMAEIIPYVDVGNGWEQLGVFYTDQRTLASYGIVTLLAYDSMLKADTVWEPNQDLTFPMTMPNAVNEIAKLMGITVDSRTVLNSAYSIDYPANDYTLRDVLKYIAAAHGGNWMITRNDQLLLVPLNGATPAETNYLVTEDGNAITFGGVRILV